MTFPWARTDGQAAARKPTLLVQDILDPDACDRAFRDIKPHNVIHLAAQHFVPWCEEHMYEAYTLNVTGTLNVLECARRYGVQDFFLASTGDVYPPNFVPHREVDPTGPVYVYGHTKFMAEQMCMRYFESKTCFRTLLIGRLFNAAGPRETNPHMLAEVTRRSRRRASAKWKSEISGRCAITSTSTRWAPSLSTHCRRWRDWRSSTSDPAARWRSARH